MGDTETAIPEISGSLFAYWNERGMRVIESATKIMTHYKRRDGIPNPTAPFNPKTFDRSKPWFVQLWGDFKPGRGSNPTEVAATLMNEPQVELLAFLGPTREGYPLVMMKSEFERDYVRD